MWESERERRRDEGMWTRERERLRELVRDRGREGERREPEREVEYLPLQGNGSLCAGLLG